MTVIFVFNVNILVLPSGDVLRSSAAGPLSLLSTLRHCCVLTQDSPIPVLAPKTGDPVSLVSSLPLFASLRALCTQLDY